jgi:autotransporter-associated beta strand protein
MQKMKSPSALILACMLLASGLITTQAQSITNADSASTLNLGGSWVGGVPAGPANIAVWDSTVQGNTTKTLGGNLAWGGIQIFNPAGLITIATDGNTLTNGASGIDMSHASTGLTLSCPLVLAADQTWNVTNGQALNINGQLLASTATTLTLNGPGMSQFSATVNGTYTGNVILNGGILNIVGAGANTSSAIGTGVITNNGGTLLSAGKIVGNVLKFNGTCFVDANLSSFTLDGAWQGSGTVILTNMTSSSTVTAGGNGNGGGSMANFTGTVVVSSLNSDGSTTAGSFRFNNGGANNNVGNAAMTLDLGNGNAHFTEKNSSVTTTFGALYGGPNTQLAQPEKYVIGALNVANDVFSGTVTGAASTFTKTGTGVFTWNNTNANTYTGATTINGGILQIGDGVTPAAGSLGLSPIVITPPGILVLNNPDDSVMTNGVSGTGNLIKTNVNALTYYGTNSGSGTTIVSQGSWILGTGALMVDPISVASGASFDVSQNPSFALNQTLSGFGTVNGPLTAVGGSINPGAPGAVGTLTFANGLTESGNVNNVFALSAPTGTNDLINVVGDLTLSGANTITITAFGGGTIANGVYPLIAYSGALSGSLANFTVAAVGVNGTLTNITSTTPSEIGVIITPPSRGPTNLTWKGDGTLNNWDSTSSNWVNGTTPFSFLAGDKVTFDDSGAPNTAVNLNIPVLPAAVTFSNSIPYTLAGNGSIEGSVGLTKTNSGSVLVLTTNSYTGPTVVGQGTLEVQNVGVSGAPSAIGAASGNPTNLVLSGGTFKYSGAAASTDHGLTLSGSGGTFDVVSGTTLTLNGTLAGAGSLALSDTGTLTLGNANTYTGGTVISNGVLALGSNNANNSGAGGSGVGPTNSPVTFYGGTLQLFGYNGSTTPNYNSFYNPLIVPAGQTGTLQMFPRGQASGNPGLGSPLTGSGTLNLVVNYVRGGLDGDWSAFTGLINVTGKNVSGDEFRINNRFGYANAAIILNDGVLMDRTSGSNPTNDIGELAGTSGAIVGPGNSSSGSPTWRVGWRNSTAVFAGTIQDDGHTSIIKVGTGTWYLAGQNTFSGSTIISNGVLSLTNIGNGDPSIANSTNIYIGTGATLDVSGRSDGTMPLNFGQVLSGSGTLNGILDTTPGGTVSGGSGIDGSTGTLTVTNHINLGGTTWMKLNRTASPQSDVLASPAINLSGTLMVTNIGANLHAGDMFTLFSGALSGTFGSVILPNYYTWDTSQLATTGTIRVIAFNPPKLAVDFSTLSSGSIAINASNGLPFGPVSVLGTTNVALPASNWTVVATGNFDGAGNFTSPVTIDPALPTQFFMLQVQ